MAGSAFKDRATVKLLQHFTPILVDANTEPDIKNKYGVRGYPTVAFATTKGEVVKSVVGYMATGQFLAAAKAAKKKAKTGKPSKAYKALTKAQAELDKALAANKTKSALAAIAKIEKVGRRGAILDSARATRADLLQRGSSQIAVAKKAIDAGKLEDAMTILRKVNMAYKGTSVGKEASKLLKELKAQMEK